MSVTVECAADSIIAWNQAQKNIFHNDGRYVIAVKSSSGGTPPDSPADVLDFLGDPINNNVKDVADELSSRGSGVGAMLGVVYSSSHNPCEEL